MKMTASYRKDNPYRAWVYRHDGSKFIGYFKSEAEAKSYTKRAGISYKSASPYKKRKVVRRDSSIFGNLRLRF